MTVFVWERVEDLTHNYHAGGGLVFVFPDAGCC